MSFVFEVFTPNSDLILPYKPKAYDDPRAVKMFYQKEPDGLLFKAFPDCSLISIADKIIKTNSDSK